MKLTSAQRVQQFLAREDAALKLYRGTDHYERMATEILLLVSCPEPPSVVPVSPVRADREALVEEIALELEPFRGEAGWLRMRGLDAHAAIQRVLAAYDALRATPEPDREAVVEAAQNVCDVDAWQPENPVPGWYLTEECGEWQDRRREAIDKLRTAIRVTPEPERAE